MFVPPHRSLVQICTIVITLRTALCFPQFDLRLEQNVGNNELAKGDSHLANLDVDKYPAPAPIHNIQQSDIRDFLQWIYPTQPPKCDNGLFAFCCDWPAPSPYIGISRPPNVDPAEVKKRRRKCGKWIQNRPGCLIPENNFCCDCKDVNAVAYNCYNPFYRDDSRFQGKPEPKPSPLGHPIELNPPEPLELDLGKNKELYRDPRDGKSGERDWIKRRAMVTSATNKIKITTSASAGGGIRGTGANTQPLRDWKMAQPQAVDDGDDPDGTREDVEIMRTWKRAQPQVADDGDDLDGTRADVEITRAWKKAPPQIADDGEDPDGSGADVEIMRVWKGAQPAITDGDDTDGTGEDVEIMRALKRAPLQVADDGDDHNSKGADVGIMKAWKRAQHEVADGDDTKNVGADVQLLRPWKRAQPAVADSDDTVGTGAEHAQIMRVWKRAQPEVSAGEPDSTEKIGANAQLFAAWKQSQAWESAKGSAGEGNGVGEEEHYDARATGNPRDNDPAMCKKDYLKDLGVFS